MRSRALAGPLRAFLDARTPKDPSRFGSAGGAGGGQNPLRRGRRYWKNAPPESRAAGGLARVSLQGRAARLAPLPRASRPLSGLFPFPLPAPHLGGDPHPLLAGGRVFTHRSPSCHTSSWSACSSSSHPIFQFISSAILLLSRSGKLGMIDMVPRSVSNRPYVRHPGRHAHGPRPLPRLQPLPIYPSWSSSISPNLSPSCRRFHSRIVLGHSFYYFVLVPSPFEAWLYSRVALRG